MKNRVAYFGVYTALALIFSYVESLIPINFGIPGVKLGLANLLIVIALWKMTVKEAYVLSIVRVILSGFIFGNLFSISYSLAGALFSVTVMAVLKKSNQFGTIVISMTGGVFHNVGQLIMAIVLLESVSIVYYLPVLMLSGMVTGTVIGILANEMLKRLSKMQL